MKGSPELDADLAYRARNGDLAAYRTLVETYQEQVLRIGFRISGDFHAAEDIAQDSFLKAFRKLDTFDPNKGRFSSWLFRITQNLALNARRKITPFPTPTKEGSGDLPSPSQATEQRDQMRQLDEVIQSLEEPFRTTFLLAEVEELPIAQISEIENVPIGTIKSRISRAKAKLRESLTQSAPSTT